MSNITTSNNCVEFGLYCAYTAIGFVAPVIAIPVLAFESIHATGLTILKAYHHSKTIDESGNPINSFAADGGKKPRYMDFDEEFEITDLTRLEHEEKKLWAEKELLIVTRRLKMATISLIPVIGFPIAVYIRNAEYKHFQDLDDEIFHKWNAAASRVDDIMKAAAIRYMK